MPLSGDAEEGREGGREEGREEGRERGRRKGEQKRRKEEEGSENLRDGKERYTGGVENSCCLPFLAGFLWSVQLLSHTPDLSPRLSSSGPSRMVDLA